MHFTVLADMFNPQQYILGEENSELIGQYVVWLVEVDDRILSVIQSLLSATKSWSGPQASQYL